eukprot:scaffold71103_cov67-Phaeocystis_antarctica.AAC.2
MAISHTLSKEQLATLTFTSRASRIAGALSRARPLPTRTDDLTSPDSARRGCPRLGLGLRTVGGLRLPRLRGELLLQLVEAIDQPLLRHLDRRDGEVRAVATAAAKVLLRHAVVEEDCGVVGADGLRALGVDGVDSRGGRGGLLLARVGLALLARPVDRRIVAFDADEALAARLVRKGLRAPRTDALREAYHARVGLAPRDVEEQVGPLPQKGRLQARDVGH